MTAAADPKGKMTMNNQFGQLARELDKESASWLQEAMPEIFDALEVAVIHGAAPEDIRAFVLRRVGPDRMALAAHCEAAARHLGEAK